MGRSLLGVFFLTAGLVALASIAKGTTRPAARKIEDRGSRMEDRAPSILDPQSSILDSRILPAPSFHARFSLN